MSYVDKMIVIKVVFLEKIPLVRNGQPKSFVIPHLSPTFIDEMIQKS